MNKGKMMALKEHRKKQAKAKEERRAERAKQPKAAKK